ncbi:MAG: DHH family phosphoesterase [Bacilli bacterium]|nr:DHH family phosphoesterase [Bacilli bacterium]
MQKLFQKEKKNILIICILELVISGFTFLNYYLGNFLRINIPSEYIYTILLAIIFVVNIIYLLIIFSKVDNLNNINTKRTNFVLTNNIEEVFSFTESGIIFYDDDFNVIWINDFIDNRIFNIVGKNLIKFNNDFCKILEDKNDTCKLTINNKIYECRCLKELKVVLIKDINQYETLYSTYKNEAPVIFQINLDNYSDVSTMLDESTFSELEVEVRSVIMEWAKENRALLKKVRNDAYIAIIQENAYDTILKGKFELINAVRNIREDDNSLTISIGIGRGINDFVKLNEMSLSALDVALSRGGDQCVVNTYGKNMEFYGGASESKSKRHKVKVKVVAKSINALIQSSDNIYIMGHIDADFDAIGACLGIYEMAKKVNKNVKIIYEDRFVEIKARTAFRTLFEKEEVDEMVIDADSAVKEINENSLLILADVSNPNIVMSKDVLNKIDRAVIIDHHRPGEKLFSQIYSYQESAASSTCEMVTELIRSCEDKINISNEIATYMLAGILLDTNNYKNKTGSRTYEASMILKEYGADNNQASEFLKEEYEEYLLKTKIAANSYTPYYGIVVSVADDEDLIDKPTLAKVANGILDVKEIKACFVIGRVSNESIGISARSDGSVNVQKIMESLDGGGHFSAAATEIKDITVEEAKELLASKMEGFIGDTRITE